MIALPTLKVVQLLNTYTKTKLGNAIKCLAKVVNKIPESLVSEVCKKLITSITNASKKEEISNIDIYATCLKTLINEIPENFAEIMCKTLATSGLSNYYS